MGRGKATCGGISNSWLPGGARGGAPEQVQLAREGSQAEATPSCSRESPKWSLRGQRQCTCGMGEGQNKSPCSGPAAQGNQPNGASVDRGSVPAGWGRGRISPLAVAQLLKGISQMEPLRSKESVQWLFHGQRQCTHERGARLLIRNLQNGASMVRVSVPGRGREPLGLKMFCKGWGMAPPAR